VISLVCAVALYKGEAQPWTGSPQAISTSILMQLSGFPLIRGPYDLKLTVNGYAMNASALHSIKLVDSSLANGATILFFPSYLPERVKALCGMPCLLDMTITMIKEPIKRVSFSLSYFLYPEADTLSIVPTMGPVGGGTIFTLTLLDFTGTGTRDKANLPNLLSVYKGKSELMVWFQIAEESWNGTVLKMTENTAERTTGTMVVDLEVKLPESVAGEGLATIFFTIDGVHFNVEESSAILQFEYVGMKILYVTPQSGHLNPGSGGMELNIVVLNLPQDLSDLNILIGNGPCVIDRIAHTDSELGVASSIACLAGELPLAEVGLIEIVVSAPAMKKILRIDWQYLAPPKPSIDAESVHFDGRNKLWAASGRKGRSSKLKINHLSPKFSVIFDEIRIQVKGEWDGMVFERNATDVLFVPIGTNAEVVFMTPELMPPAWMYVTVSIHREGVLLMDLTHFSDSQPFHVEFRDLLQPRTVAWAPREGSVRGGILWMAGVQSFDSYFSRNQNSEDNPIEVEFGTSTPNHDARAEVLAVLSVADYREQGARYSEVMAIQRIDSWFIGISNDYRSDVVQQTVFAIEDSAFDPDAAFQVAAILFVWIPSYPAGEVPVSIKAGKVHVVANFKYMNDPQGSATLLSATTDAGDLRSGMGGNVRVVVVLSNFDIVYKGSDIQVMFGKEMLPVNRLAVSSSSETKLYLVVPPSLPGVVEVKISPMTKPTNVATFQFTYWDDRLPVLKSLSPFLVYVTGGVAINMTGSDVPVLDSLDQYRVVIRQGLRVTTVRLNWLDVGLDATSLSFLVPVGTAGAASVELWADVDETISKGSNRMALEFAAIPDTPPTVFLVTPSSSSNFGNVKISVSMRNMKVVPSASMLRVELVLRGDGGVQLTMLLNPTVNTSTGISVRSQMTQTLVSFLTPQFSEGGTVAVRIWEIGREDLVAETALTIIDENIASLLYSFPDIAKANEEAIMEVGVSRMGILPPIADMYAGSSAGVNIAIMSAYTTAKGDTVLVVRIKKEDGLFGRVNVTLAACANIFSCSKKSVQFTFYFRDPNAVWINDLSPMSMFVDGRLPVGVDIENLPSGLTTTDFVVTFVTNATVDSVEYQPEPLVNGKFQIKLTVTAPNVQEPQFLRPVVLIPRLGVRSEVPFDFTYLSAPSPSFQTVVPAKAKTTVSSPISISLQNFPGVSTKVSFPARPP
jgi:hypothetical protein